MLTNFLTGLFTYETKKRVYIHNVFIGVLRRVIQLAILVYILAYVLFYKKGYQSTEYGTHATVIKVKGAIKKARESETGEKKETVYDVLDLVYPSKERDGFFLTTNLLKFTNQSMGLCLDEESVCRNVTDCEPGQVSHSGYGFYSFLC